MPLVSFVVPVHNAVLTLPRCLNSLLAQTEKDWEAICVNDASDDCSREVLQKFAARDARFKILNQADCGPGTAGIWEFLMPKANILPLLTPMIGCLPI